jgi:hypothetical protein
MLEAVFLAILAKLVKLLHADLEAQESLINWD